MKKNMYKAVNVKNINVSELRSKVEGQKIVFGIDVAKTQFFGALLNEEKKNLMIIKWLSPYDVKIVVDLLANLPTSQLEVAMEPSGTYGDALRELLMDAGIKVYLVAPQRTHAAAELFDGVPSLHDPKCSTLVARLHLDGISKEWLKKSEKERELDAYCNNMDRLKKTFSGNLNQLEAKLAGIWPELLKFLSLGSITMLRLLEEFGCPGNVAEAPLEARVFMRRVSRRALQEKKIENIINSASETIGKKLIPAEIEDIQSFCSDLIELRKKLNAAKKRVEKFAVRFSVIKAMSKTVGLITAAVIYSKAGDPRKYNCAKAFIKALGLNLKVKSSGRKTGYLKITKRGPGRVRFYLYMAALRQIYSNTIFASWYANNTKNREKGRNGGKKGKAIVALMRKLAAGLWHVCQGNEFDAGKLFDLKRLRLEKDSVTGKYYKIHNKRTQKKDHKPKSSKDENQESKEYKIREATA